jgi:hypothetical protein
VRHTTPEGVVAATCVDTPSGLVARPDNPGRAGAVAWPAQEPSGQRYSLDQAISDRAQLGTIAFDALAFLTGDFNADTFLPPGKVSDYFGFQYLRDIDAAGAGHNTSFLSRIADNILAILSDVQKAQLIALGRSQASDIRRFAEMRLPLIMAFRRNLAGDLPKGATGLDRQAVLRHSADLYGLDGLLAYQRAGVMASVLRGLDPSQKAALARLQFGNSSTWPALPPQLDRRSLPHVVDVAVMTYASELFSWHAGSIEADTYFCPERHGMYFGGFGMKTAPAMGKRDYAISTSLTGDSGQAFLEILDAGQRRLLEDLVRQQRPDLQEIVRVRRAIATELRRFLRGEMADQAGVIALSRRYGELDGNLSYLYATTFANIARSLSPAQAQGIRSLRKDASSGPTGPFLYSTPISLPNVGDTKHFFAPGR